MINTTQTAYLSGGCFWGMEELVRQIPGVLETEVGYTGGNIPNATYERHNGHAEALKIVFDPQQLTYRHLLFEFFRMHNPTTKNRQGNDIGTSYRSSIFYMGEEQKQVAEDVIRCVDASGEWVHPLRQRWCRTVSSGMPKITTRITSSSIRMATPVILCASSI